MLTPPQMLRRAAPPGFFPVRTALNSNHAAITDDDPTSQAVSAQPADWRTALHGHGGP